MRGPTIAMLVVACACVAAVGAGLLGVGKPSCSDIDWRAWRSPGSTEGMYPTTRQKIADRAMTCGVLMRMSRASVRARLGKPDVGNRRARRWHWVIGPPAVPIDTEELILEFAGGRVIRQSRAVG